MQQSMIHIHTAPFGLLDVFGVPQRRLFFCNCPFSLQFFTSAQLFCRESRTCLTKSHLWKNWCRIHCAPATVGCAGSSSKIFAEVTTGWHHIVPLTLPNFVVGVPASERSLFLLVMCLLATQTQKGIRRETNKASQKGPPLLQSGFSSGAGNSPRCSVADSLQLHAWTRRFRGWGTIEEEHCRGPCYSTEQLAISRQSVVLVREGSEVQTRRTD